MTSPGKFGRADPGELPGTADALNSSNGTDRGPFGPHTRSIIAAGIGAVAQDKTPLYILEPDGEYIGFLHENGGNGIIAESGQVDKT